MRKDFGAKMYLYPQPVMIIATYNEDGTENAMITSWGGIAGNDEIIIDLGSHRTTDNIMRNRAFTVCITDADHIVACDYVGIVSARKEPNKFKKAGFTAEKSRFVNAPVIKELPLALECELEDVHDGRILGKIKNVSADERILGSDGEISLEKFSPVTFDPVHHDYYALGKKVGNAFKDGVALK